MAARQVPSGKAEAAGSRVNTFLALYRVRARKRAPLPRRRLGSLLAKTGPSLEESLFLPSLVAIAEEYSTTLLVGKSETLAKAGPPMLASLWRSSMEQTETSWERQISAWEDWHQIRLVDAPGFNAFRGFIEARNAILHGLGELTPRQLRGKRANRVLNYLREAGIELDGVTLRLKPADVETCATRALALIAWLDDATR